jgi:hypothetical protein
VSVDGEKREMEKVTNELCHPAIQEWPDRPQLSHSDILQNTKESQRNAKATAQKIGLIVNAIHN